MEKKIYVNRNKLKVTLMKNKMEHFKLFKKAKSGHEKLIKDINKLFNEYEYDFEELNDVFEFEREAIEIIGFLKEFIINNPPVDKTEEYSKHIQIFDSESRESIPLDDEEFKKYIADSWEWSKTVNNLNKSYSEYLEDGGCFTTTE